MGLKWCCDYYECKAKIDAEFAETNGWDCVQLTLKSINKALDPVFKTYILCPKHLLYVKNIIEGGLLAFDK